MHTVIETSDDRFQQHWHTLLNNDPLQNPLYKSCTEVQSETEVRENGYTDRSFLIVSEEGPVFGCSLTVHVDAEGRKRLGYFGLEASTHVNRASLKNPSNNFCPEVIRLLQQHVDQLLDEEQPQAIDYLDPVSCGIMSPVTQVLLQKGAVPTVHEVRLIDLRQDSDELLINVSDQYQRYINWGQENLEVSVVHGGDFHQAMERSESEFGVYSNALDAALHNYFNLLSQGQGFLVQANYQGSLAISALFVYSKRTCQFVFADLLQDSGTGRADKPLIQQVIWRGIMESKSLGCEQFDFGYGRCGESTPDINTLSAEQFGGVAHTRLKVSLLQDFSMPASAYLS